MANRYEVPSWDGLEWRSSLPAEALLVGQGAPTALLAVASNFWLAEKEPAKYVRAMALVLREQLIPETKETKLANHQLRYRRHPAMVSEWEDRAALGDALWAMGWRAQKLCTEESNTGLLVLDVAAAFDPSDLESMERYRELSAGQMELRWLGAVRLPEYIDAPDYADRADAVADSDSNSHLVSTVVEDPVPKIFSFGTKSASILVPASSGSKDRFVRLEARGVEIDRESERKRRDGDKRKINDPRLRVEFAAGRDNADVAALIELQLERARVEFLRRRPGLEFPWAAGVRFRVVDGAEPASGDMISAAAGVLMESMAQGLALAPDAAAAGLVGFGSTLQWSGSLSAVLVSNGQLETGQAQYPKTLMAVPIHCEADVADLAALGEYRLLMNNQIVGCRRIDDALLTVSADPGADRARAFALFAEISRAAERIPPHVLLANTKVRARLAEVLKLCPQHLSAAQLQRAAAGDGVLASMASSVERLQQIDQQVRAWVAAHLAGGGGARDSVDRYDDLCAGVQNTLRTLRPRIDPKARSYADGMSSLVQDFRISLRSQARGGGSGSGVAARRAEALREALRSLAVEVAALSVEGA
jgi:hypothetical protein